MNKIFINLLFALAINFSLNASASVVKYDQTNRKGLSLEQRAEKIKELLENQQEVVVWICHTKYVLNPQDPQFDEVSKEISNFLKNVTEYDKLRKAEQTSINLPDGNGINHDRFERSSFVVSDYSKVWSEQ